MKVTVVVVFKNGVYASVAVFRYRTAAGAYAAQCEAAGNAVQVTEKVVHETALFS